MAPNKKKQKRKGRVLKTTLSKRKKKEMKKEAKWSFFFNFLKEIHFFFFTHPIPACMIAYTLKIKLIKEKNKHKKKKVFVSFPLGRTRYTILVSLTFEEHPRMA